MVDANAILERLEMKLRVGDRVRTRAGAEGNILEVRTWRDEISLMTDAESLDFTAKLLASMGPNFRDTWRRILVAEAHRTSWYDYPSDIETVHQGR